MVQMMLKSVFYKLIFDIFNEINIIFLKLKYANNPKIYLGLGFVF